MALSSGDTSVTGNLRRKVVAARARMWAWAVGSGVTATKRFARRIREQAAKPPRRKKKEPEASATSETPEPQVEVEEVETATQAGPERVEPERVESPPKTEFETVEVVGPSVQREPEELSSEARLEEARHEHDEDRVDSASEDSFPASDPPGWTSTGSR